MSAGEAILITALDGAVDGVGAFGDVPADRPKEFITVERTGGSRSLIMDSGTYAVQVWATSRARAADLADQVASWILNELPKCPQVGAVGVASMYNLPNPDSRTPRYQLTLSLTAILSQTDKSPPWPRGGLKAFTTE